MEPVPDAKIRKSIEKTSEYTPFMWKELSEQTTNKHPLNRMNRVRFRGCFSYDGEAVMITHFCAFLFFCCIFHRTPYLRAIYRESSVGCNTCRHQLVQALFVGFSQFGQTTCTVFVESVPIQK